ncbi:hypothetical protein WJX72_011252 [[Myrmecia] bisecta]|uniref:Uncharacterized protein n=1 Tax=[Myrmecia] bisecta TaxID=41462 RepID=A0AAW1P769_9CHLO
MCVDRGAELDELKREGAWLGAAAGLLADVPELKALIDWPALLGNLRAYSPTWVHRAPGNEKRLLDLAPENLVREKLGDEPVVIEADDCDRAAEPGKYEEPKKGASTLNQLQAEFQERGAKAADILLAYALVTAQLTRAQVDELAADGATFEAAAELLVQVPEVVKVTAGCEQAG